MPGLIDKLYKVQKQDFPKACKVLADAFQHDPIWNAIYETVPGIDSKVNVFYEILLRHCLKFGGVYATSDKLEGIAGWVPGYLADMTVLRLLRSGAFIPGMKIGFKLMKRMMPVLELIERDRKQNMKGMSFLYLQIIGVSTAYQGQGYGGRLLRALIEKSEQARLPVYLETETENNVKMYQRFGFGINKEIILPVINCPMWEMVRESVK